MNSDIPFLLAHLRILFTSGLPAKYVKQKHFSQLGKLMALAPPLKKLNFRHWLLPLLSKMQQPAAQFYRRNLSTLGHRKGMVVESLNVKSLLLHIDEIRILVKELGIHILALNETKRDKNIDDSLVNIEGYTI